MATPPAPLKIALLSFEYPPETGFGGIGTYTWHHARALAALGHEVHVLAGAREATALRTEEHDGVRVHRFWADGRAMRAFEWLGTFRLWWTRQRLQNAWSMYRGIAALHRVHHFDVIEMPECGGEGALVTRLLRVPTVVRLHSPSRLIMGSYDVRRADVVLCSAIEQRALYAATALTSCSRFLAGEVAEKLGVRRPISVITNGLDVEWFDGSVEHVDVHAKYGLPRRKLMILFTGRMERRKGIHLAPEIARSILERFDVTFVLAGADLFGYVANTLLPALADRPLKGSIHWLGALPLGDLRPLVSAADIFLLPSIWENCPYSCLEAMAAGKAIVCAEQGGMPELIRHGVSGLLATSDDASSFVAQLERLVEDSELRDRLGRAARETIMAAHSHLHVARQAVDLYRDIIAGRAHRASLNVTIVIPAYNAAATIAQALRSVSEQSSSSWEAIVVNDGSTDETSSIAKAFGARDARIRVIDQPNAGEAAARNTGIRRARHDWLLFLDADDWIAPDHLQTMTARLMEDDSLDAVHCGYARVAADGSITHDAFRPATGDLFSTLACRAAFAVHACIVRKTLVEEVGLFDPSVKTSPDWDLWQRVARAGANFGAVPDVLAFYRMSPNGASLDAPQLLSDGLRVMRQGRTADSRVPRPRPVHAQGHAAPMHVQTFYLLSWCAGLMIGSGRDPSPLFDLVGEDQFPALYPAAVAQCLFDSVPLPLCQSPRSWETLWPALQPRLADFLSALETHAGAPGFAAEAISSLERMALAASPVSDPTPDPDAPS